MVKRVFLSMLLAVLACNVSFSQTGNDSVVRSGGRERVGLVLSGGGAKGIAHVGVIKALEDNDIPIDYVAGTSMGAIVGSLYSCGWSPEKMIKFFTAPDFIYWSTGVINPDHKYYLTQPSPTPRWLTANINLR
ncbi:patatin-like phospholipase family protein, partial [uncultured Duncaniella sp.]